MIILYLYLLVHLCTCNVADNLESYAVPIMKAKKGLSHLFTFRMYGFAAQLNWGISKGCASATPGSNGLISTDVKLDNILFDS